jgi:hypothetical protein
MKIISLKDPLVLEGKEAIISMGSKDLNPNPYLFLKAFIDRNDLQLGDDILECLRRSGNKIVPVRPEPTEEQKNTKEYTMFTTKFEDYD